MTDVSRCDDGGFARWGDRAMDVYGVAMRRSPEIVAQRRAVLATHLTRPGFRAAVALDGPTADRRLVGFGYAYQGRPGQWWHDAVSVEVRARLGGQPARRWLDDSVEVVELHVLPEHQGHGLGRALLRTLLDGATESTALLSTHDQDSPARRLYRGEGFVDLLTGFVFPHGHEVFAVMGKPLR